MLALSCLTATVAGTGVASGATSFYSDRTLFLAGVNVAQTIDFEGLAPENDWLDLDPPGLIVIDGNTFSANLGLAVVDDGIDSLYQWNSGAMIQAWASTYGGDGTGANGLRVTFSAPASAVGFDYFTLQPQALPVMVTLSNGETFGPFSSADRPTMTFAGFLTDAPITWIQLDSASDLDYVQMDNFVLGNVPEPGIAALSAMAALGLLAPRRR